MSFFCPKLDNIFSNQQFKIHGYKLYQRDRNKHRGGVIFCISKNIPCKAVSLKKVPGYCKIILIEFSIKTRKWLRISLYKLPSQNDKYFLDNLSLTLKKQAKDNTTIIL